jgi:hypothetical protein
MNEEAAISKMRDVLRLRHMAHSTEETYVHWLRKFIRFIPRLPDEMGCSVPSPLEAM